MLFFVILWTLKDYCVDKKIAITGLGHVGLSLARLFVTKYFVVGFDVNKIRIKEFKKGVDTTTGAV